MAERESVREIAANTLAELGKLEAEQAEWWSRIDSGSYLDELEEPLWSFFESCLDISRLERVRGSGPDTDHETVQWELLLGYGGPNVRLYLEPGGAATVEAVWWSAPERVTGELPWLAAQMEELGL